MISFLFPGFLYAAGAVSLGVVALHLIVTQQPKSDVLPTVRFFPDVVARSTSLTIQPSDLLLMLVRVVLIMLIGAAFAQPRLRLQHQVTARLVAIDVSRTIGDPAELADSARRYAAGAIAVILFDSTAREIPASTALDSLRPVTARMNAAGSTLRTKGALSGAMIALLRTAARLRDRADSLELVVVSPFATEEVDAATLTIRGLWPGHVRAVHVAMTARSAANSAAAARPRVEWADSGATAVWVKRSHIDTIGAVRAGDAVLVFPFVRRWSLADTRDSAVTRVRTARTATRVYARWSDGEPAGVERQTDAGCVRSLAVALPNNGDAILRPEFLRFVSALQQPCGAPRDFAPLSASYTATFEGVVHLAPTNMVKPRTTRMTPLVPWLLVSCLVLALVELLVSRWAIRSRTPSAVGNVEISPRHAA